MTENADPKTLSDHELLKEIDDQAARMASIRCQLIDDKTNRMIGDQTRGINWIGQAKKALALKGQYHQALLRERSIRVATEKSERNKANQEERKSDSDRFVAAARVILSKEEYLAIWNMANSKA